jgi:hypothetical protein
MGQDPIYEKRLDSMKNNEHIPYSVSIVRFHLDYRGWNLQFKTVFFNKTVQSLCQSCMKRLVCMLLLSTRVLEMLFWGAFPSKTTLPQPPSREG